MSEEAKILSDVPDDVVEEVDDSPVEHDLKTYHTQIRYILAVMGFWCFFMLASLRINLSVGIVAMVNWSEIKKDVIPKESKARECNYINSTVRTSEEDGHILWEPHIQGHVLSCYFFGLASMQLAGLRIAESVSAKYVLLVGTMVATLMNFLIPVVARQSGYGVMALQVFKGLGQGVVIPAFSVLMGKWVPMSARPRFMRVVSSGLPVGGFFTVAISGIISKLPELGWPYVFYIFGIVAVLWCVFWTILIYDSPLTHPSITQTAANRIMTQRKQKRLNMRLPIPTFSILCCRPVWAYIAAGFASFWALCLYVTVIPTFMGTVLKFNIETNGLVSAVPHLAEAIVLTSTGFAADHLLRKDVCTVTTLRKTCITTGLVGFAVCMVIVTFTGCYRNITVFFLVLALGLSGLSFACTAVVPVDMAPRFTGTIAGIMNTFGALAGAIIPTLVGYQTKNAQTMHEWSLVFYGTALVCLLGAVIFIAFGSCKLQPWSNHPLVNPPSPTQESPGQQNELNERSKDNPDSPAPATPPPSTTSIQEEEKQTQDEDRPWRT